MTFSARQKKLDGNRQNERNNDQNGVEKVSFVLQFLSHFEYVGIVKYVLTHDTESSVERHAVLCLYVIVIVCFVMFQRTLCVMYR
jgi:hypothetical protein